MKFRAIPLLFLLALFALMSNAQTGTGTLVGTVTDQTGAVMANVTVQATHVATGTISTASTSDTGNYNLSQLRVGDYEVVIEQTGFKTYRRTGVALSISQTLRLDAQLEVGAAADSVTVTAEASLLNTDSGTLTTNLSPRTIQNIPLLPVGTFIRDPFALSNTVAGVLQTFVGTRVNGLGQSTIQYRLDGEILGQQGFAGITTRTQPSPDAIEEVAVQTSNISAEFGSASGAVYNVSIKSGTNKYHGTVYDYAVNEILNAADPGNNVRGRVRRHDYGFNIGGPVKIPGIYDGENKSFFFFNWEQYRDKQNVTTFTRPTVPTAEYRAGNFSGLFAASNNANLRINATGGQRDYLDPLGNVVRLGTVYDPRTTRTVTCNAALSQDCAAGSQISVRDPFPGNIIPTSLFDPVAVATLTKYVPLPNQPSLINNYYNPFTTTRTTTSPAIKGDQNLGSKGRLSFTYTQNKTSSPIQALNLSEGFPEPITGNQGTFESAPTYRLNFDYTIAPTLNYHLGLGYSIFEFSNRTQTTDYNALTDIGLRGATLNRNFPRFNIGAQTNPATGGMNTIGTANQGDSPERRPSISQTLTWVHGNHTIKTGADWRQDMLPTRTFTGANGVYNFGGLGATWQPSLLNVAGFAGNTNVGFTFANFLMGSVRSATLSQPITFRRSKQQWGMFLQDTWRARRNLTIDIGLRYDYGTYFREDFGRLGALGLNQTNDSAGNHPGGLIYEATCKCEFANNYPLAFGPRLGFAYTLNPKTVFRGGFGVAYGSIQNLVLGAANSANTADVQDGQDSFRLRDGMPTNIQPAWPTFANNQGLLPGAVGGAPTLVDRNAGRPDRTFQWNLALQREVARDLVVEAAYVANRNVWSPAGGFQDFNAISEQQLARYGFTVGNTADAQLLQQTLTLANSSALAQRGVFRPYSNFPTNQTVFQSLRPYPQYSGAIAPALAPMGKSWYDSLQLTLTKRFSRGLQATANYTYSKNLQHVSAFDVFNRANGKDIVGGNPPQVLRITFAYQTPRPSDSIPVLGSRAVSWAVRDWQVSAAMFYQTATYLGRPTNTGAFPISQWLGRGPGGAQLKQNSDGSYMNPWSVNWKDLDGKTRTDALDINCACFDPNTTQVLNPAAWENIPAGQWGAQTQIIPGFRNARRPNESFNTARNFAFGAEGRYTLQVRVEFQNIFNRKFVPALSTTNLGNYQTAPNPVLGSRNPTTGAIATAYTAGFGTFGNLSNPGQFGTPRSGQFIARFSF